LAQSVMANLIAAGTYQQLGRTEEQKSALSRAGREVQALEKLSHVPVAAVARLFYFRETGDHDASLAQVLNRSQSGIRLSDLDETYLALELYEHQEFQRAIDVLDKSIARGGNTYLKQIFRCVILAELPDGPARARAAVPELNASNVFAIYVPAIFQHLGLRAEAVAAYKSLGQKFLESNARSEWVIRLLEFGSGQISVDRLMAAAGSTRLNRCEANFFIGMSRLADGDRNGARVHFQNAVNTHVIWYVDHNLSRAFLSRLDADAKWPPWIPQRAPMPGPSFPPKSR